MQDTGSLTKLERHSEGKWVGTIDVHSGTNKLDVTRKTAEKGNELLLSYKVHTGTHVDKPTRKTYIGLCLMSLQICV